MSKYVEFIEQQHLKPIEIEEKQQLYFDLDQLEHSMSGRSDANLSNTFLIESVYLLRNAVFLFESGLFDCAFYSLRESIEISMTMVYLSELPEKEREEELSKWRNEQFFPMYKGMVEALDEHQTSLADIRELLSNYFDTVEQFRKRLNKFVHKQGFDKLYFSRNHPLSKYKDYDQFRSDFIADLQKCIGIVAIMRLAIDPLPLLLADEEIYYRTPGFITKPYSYKFIDKYIESENVQKLKSTEQYSSFHEHFMQFEKQNKFVAEVIKDNYVRTEKIDDILSQYHLLGPTNLIIVLLYKLSGKIVKVYAYDGFLPYFSDRNTIRTSLNWSSLDFDGFKKSGIQFNNKYDESYISYVVLQEEHYFFEHNEIFSKAEMADFEKISEYVETWE